MFSDKSSIRSNFHGRFFIDVHKLNQQTNKISSINSSKENTTNNYQKCRSDDIINEDEEENQRNKNKKKSSKKKENEKMNHHHHPIIGNLISKNDTNKMNLLQIKQDLFSCNNNQKNKEINFYNVISKSNNSIEETNSAASSPTSPQFYKNQMKYNTFSRIQNKLINDNSAERKKDIKEAMNTEEVASIKGNERKLKLRMRKENNSKDNDEKNNYISKNKSKLSLIIQEKDTKIEKLINEINYCKNIIAKKQYYTGNINNNDINNFINNDINNNAININDKNNKESKSIGGIKKGKTLFLNNNDYISTATSQNKRRISFNFFTKNKHNNKNSFAKKNKIYIQDSESIINNIRRVDINDQCFDSDPNIIRTKDSNQKILDRTNFRNLNIKICEDEIKNKDNSSLIKNKTTVNDLMGSNLNTNEIEQIVNSIESKNSENENDFIPSNKMTFNHISNDKKKSTLKLKVNNKNNTHIFINTKDLLSENKEIKIRKDISSKNSPNQKDNSSTEKNSINSLYRKKYSITSKNAYNPLLSNNKNSNFIVNSNNKYDNVSFNDNFTNNSGNKKFVNITINKGDKGFNNTNTRTNSNSKEFCPDLTFPTKSESSEDKYKLYQNYYYLKQHFLDRNKNISSFSLSSGVGNSNINFNELNFKENYKLLLEGLKNRMASLLFNLISFTEENQSI